MKNFVTKNFNKISVAGLILILSSSVLFYAFSTGIDGRTLKSTTTGCSCHFTGPSSSVIVFISGPDSVNVGQTVTYSVEISEPNKTGAGVDIATRSGTLGIVNTNLHISNGELVQNSNIPMTNHAVILDFSYTAPNTSTFDTIWITGLATNSNGQVNGDIWNWAPNKRINVRNPTGIKPISGNIPSSYELTQNYPNPFNPSTTIKFSLPKSSLARLVVIDLNGKIVDDLVNESLEAGDYRVNWNADKFSSGIYFFRLEANGFSETKKMILIK